MRRSIRILAAGLALGSLALAGGAEEVGVAVRVHPEVVGHGVGEPDRDIRENDAIERGLKVFLRGRDPYLKIAFTFGGCQVLKGPQDHRFTGTASFAGLSEFDFGDPNNPAASRIRLAAGQLHLKMLSKAGCKVDVETPQAFLTLGTLLRVLASPVIGTFVAVDEGSATVQAKVGGAPVVVKAGNWVLVPPGGLPTRPAPLSSGDVGKIFQDPPLLGCCTGVEPPKSRQGPP
jgi:hypothetical protein